MNDAELIAEMRERAGDGTPLRADVTFTPAEGEPVTVEDAAVSFGDAERPAFRYRFHASGRILTSLPPMVGLLVHTGYLAGHFPAPPEAT